MIEIREARRAGERADFIHVGSVPYQGDPCYIAPLQFELRRRLDPEINPTLKGAEHRLWIAYKDGDAVGRIGAIVNPLHQEKHGTLTGHFGFLEAIDDTTVFTALLETAEKWLRAQGMTTVAGPYNFSYTEECGLLIEGFDTPSCIMMPHGRPWYKDHVERAGYRKAQDLFALKYVVNKNCIAGRRKRFVDRIISDPKVEIRNLKFDTFLSDIKILVDIYNDAWSENWDMIPFTNDQAEFMASELRPIITKTNVVLCFFEGKPAAMGLVLPNLNEATADFDGKLLPFNWMKLLWRLKMRRLKSARMPLMGISKKYQRKPLGVAFAYKIIDKVNSASIKNGLEYTELSWILESNVSMLNILTDIGGEIYKTYRIFDKEL